MSTAITVPENLADGIYVGNAQVELDESERFNFCSISVAVKVSNSAICVLAEDGGICYPKASADRWLPAIVLCGCEKNYQLTFVDNFSLFLD